MPGTRSVFFLILILAVLLTSPSRPMPFIGAAESQDASLRAPFSLELPDIGRAQMSEPEINIPTSNLHKLRLRVRKPYADSINYGKIYTKINGESAVVIQTPGRDIDDQILLTLDLDKYPRFKLRPGSNVIEIQAVDQAANPYYASYVLLTGGWHNGDPALMADATIEHAVVGAASDRQPPTIYMTNPSGQRGIGARLNKSLAVQGVVTDNSGDVVSVTVNGQPATLTPATGSRLLVPIGAKASARSFAFERAIAI